MTLGTIKMTAQQFLQMGEDPPGVRLELVDGEVKVSPSPQPKHSFVDHRLTSILDQHIVANNLGELYGDVDTIFGEHDVRRPDLIFFARDRLHLVGDRAMEGPPDLCVEIISPSSSIVDRKQKFKQYERAKVANYWIVDPEQRTIEGFKLVRGRYRLMCKGTGSALICLPPFEALQIPLGELWQPARRGRA
jgi:Uma2 family endonuclease